MKRIFLIFCLLVTFCSAQQASAPAEPTVEQHRQLEAILREQRDAAAQAAQDAQAQLRLAIAEIDSLKKQIVELSAKISAPAEKSGIQNPPAPTSKK